MTNASIMLHAPASVLWFIISEEEEHAGRTWSMRHQGKVSGVEDGSRNDSK